MGELVDRFVASEARHSSRRALRRFAVGLLLVPTVVSALITAFVYVWQFAQTILE